MFRVYVWIYRPHVGNYPQQCQDLFPCSGLVWLRFAYTHRPNWTEYRLFRMQRFVGLTEYLKVGVVSCIWDIHTNARNNGRKSETNKIIINKYWKYIAIRFYYTIDMKFVSLLLQNEVLKRKIYTKTGLFAFYNSLEGWWMKWKLCTCYSITGKNSTMINIYRFGLGALRM